MSYTKTLTDAKVYRTLTLAVRALITLERKRGGCGKIVRHPSHGIVIEFYEDFSHIDGYHNWMGFVPK